VEAIANFYINYTMILILIARFPVRALYLRFYLLTNYIRRLATAMIPKMLVCEKKDQFDSK